jgi:hypothetical protein
MPGGLSKPQTNIGNIANKSGGTIGEPVVAEPKTDISQLSKSDENTIFNKKNSSDSSIKSGHNVGINEITFPSQPGKFVQSLNSSQVTTDLQQLEGGLTIAKTPEQVKQDKLLEENHAKFLAVVAVGMLSTSRAELQKNIFADSLIPKGNDTHLDIIKRNVANNQDKAHDNLITYSKALPDRADYAAPFSQAALVAISAAFTFGAGRTAASLAANPISTSLIKPEDAGDSWVKTAKASVAWALAGAGGAVGSMVHQLTTLPLFQRGLPYQLEPVPADIIVPPKLFTAMEEHSKGSGAKLKADAIALQTSAKSLGDDRAIYIGMISFGLGMLANQGAQASIGKHRAVDDGEIVGLSILGSTIGGGLTGLGSGAIMARERISVPILNHDNTLSIGENGKPRYHKVSLFYAHATDAKGVDEDAKNPNHNKNKSDATRKGNPGTVMEVAKSLNNRAKVIRSSTAVGAVILGVFENMAKSIKPEAALAVRLVVFVVAIATVIRSYFEKLGGIASADKKNKELTEASKDKLN